MGDTEPESPAPEGQPQAAPAPAAAVVPNRGLPLLIQGLLQELPSGNRWTRAKADSWLDVARVLFDLVYEFDDPKTPATPREEPGGIAPGEESDP